MRAGVVPDLVARVAAVFASLEAARTKNAARQARFRLKSVSNVTRNVTEKTSKSLKRLKSRDSNVTRNVTDREELRKLGERWNAFAGPLHLPQIEEIKAGSARERAALARIREGCDFERAFTMICSSPLLKGEVNGFRCTFDWMVNPTNYQKIVEGSYNYALPKRSTR